MAIQQPDDEAAHHHAQQHQAKAQAAKDDAEAKKREVADAKKAEAEAAEEQDEEDDKAAGPVEKLTKALKALKTSKVPYNFLLCESKPYGLVVSKKVIVNSKEHKDQLKALSGGSTRPPRTGTCFFENGKYVFTLEKPLPGPFASILQKWINSTVTGLGAKVMIGKESGDDEGTPAGNENRPALDDAADVWHETRDELSKGIDQLKSAIRKEFANEGPALLKEIENNIKKLDGVMDRLDKRLADSLKNAHGSKDNAARDAELKNAQKILNEYHTYVNSEPLIAHIDSNPFGVKVGMKDLLTSKLDHMTKAIG